MMELACAFILIFASLVSATPYGYGVKGGASARADSSASAGAFGGLGEIPAVVPLGAGFSGSFSKSSSSSSSSSSASSSSSSSSFSYGGSGAGGLSGFGLNGGTQGNVGCSSGNCQTAGTNGIPAPHGSSIQGYNSANAAAIAGAGAASGSGCQGLSCDSNSERCASGQCKPKTQTGTPSIDSDTNKCTSGQCGSTLQSSISPTEYGPNDIHVVSDTSNAAHNSKDQSSNVDKTSLSYNGAGTDCSQGKCSPSGPLNSKPSFGHDSDNSYQSTSASNKQQSSTSDAGGSSYYQKPAIHLETPKLSSQEPGRETSSSSYNVPIHGSYDNGEKKPTCDGVKCENQPKGAYPTTNSNTLSTNYLSPQHSLSTDNSVTKGPSSIDYPSSTNCRGSDCVGIPSSQVTGGPSHSEGPGNIHFGQSPSNAPTLGLTNCKTPNCSPYPTNPGNTAGSNGSPGLVSYAKPTDGNNQSNEKLPVYTGGFGAPAGVLKPNEFDVARPTGNPSYAHASTSQNGTPLGSTTSGCNSPSCSGYPSAFGANVQSGTHVQKPSGGIGSPSEKLPTYTGGFGGPAGMLKPNEYDIHATVTNGPNYAHPASSSYNTQSPANNIGTTGCTTGNCGGYSPTADATSGASVPSGYVGTTKPSIGISAPSEKLLSYTGGFGGPGGLFKPNEYDIHATVPSSPSHAPSVTYNTPTSGGNLPNAGCQTPNCYSPHTGTTAAANTQAESFGVTKPSSGPHLSSVTLPAYTSGYDKPSGINRPNEISAPALTPSYTNTQSPSSPGSYSTGCKTANCGNYPTSGASADANAQTGSFGITKPNADAHPSGPTVPQYTGSFGGPSGTLKPNEHTYVTPATGSAPSNCKTSNCANSPTASAGVISGANAQSGSFANTKPSGGINISNEKLPTYTGGFGGASGLLKPNEYTVPAVSPTPNDYNKPLAPAVGVSTPVACTSGNCNPHVPHGSAPHSHNDASNGVHATAAAVAEANAVAYTGGFGGPPGVLKPYDNGKIGVPPTIAGHAHGPQIGGHYSSPNGNINSPHGTIPGAISGAIGSAGLSGAHGNTGGQVGSITGSPAYAGSAAGASSGAHGYNTHGSHYNQAGTINGGSPCGGGCGGTSGGAYDGGPRFDFNGGLGLPKFGYSDGLNGGRSTAGASAKSLAGASAFGVGGSFASSAATAHASAGAYTKGGYGKR